MTESALVLLSTIAISSTTHHNEHTLLTRYHHGSGFKVLDVIRLIQKPGYLTEETLLLTSAVLDVEVELRQLLCPNVEASIRQLFEHHLRRITVAAVQSACDLRDGRKERSQGDVLVTLWCNARDVIYKGLRNYA